MRPLHRHTPTAALLLAGTFVLSSCSRSPAPPPPGGTADSAAAAVPVRVLELQPTPYTERLSIAGVIKAFDDVTLSTEEGGILREWKAPKGQSVKQGEVIALLNDEVLHPAYRAAQAQYQTAEMNFQKQEKVYQEQGISELQYKSTAYARDAARAQADLARARWERTFIKSPVDGVLDDHLVDAGEMAAPGLPIARIVNIERVRVQVNVPERYAGTLTRGTPITFTVLAYPREVFKGTLSHIGSTISADNRTFLVESIVANPGRKLKPEMIAKADIAQAVPRSVLLVPEEAVIQLDEGLHVAYVANGGKAAQRRVMLGARDNGRVEVVQGLQAGEHLVIDGFDRLTDGQSLTIAP